MLAGNVVDHMQQFLLGYQLGDDISAGAFPSFEFVVTHSGLLKKKDPGSARHTGAKCRDVVGSI